MTSIRPNYTYYKIDFALRVLQLIFAIIVIGTDSYAIHVFRSWFGSYADYYGVPDAWSFLLFCAIWTVLGAPFCFIAGIRYDDHVLLGYIRVAVDAVAVLSWFAGFIAVAINIASDACPAEERYCRAIEVATVFGALEWLVFMLTTAMTVRNVLDELRRTRALKASRDITA